MRKSPKVALLPGLAYIVTILNILITYFLEPYLEFCWRLGGDAEVVLSNIASGGGGKSGNKYSEFSKETCWDTGCWYLGLLVVDSPPLPDFEPDFELVFCLLSMPLDVTLSLGLGLISGGCFFWEDLKRKNILWEFYGHAVIL